MFLAIDFSISMETHKYFSATYLAIKIFMKPLIYKICLTQTLIISSLFIPSTTSAQIVPDNTLNAPSQITINGNTITINSGTTVGQNLFHSFESFSVPEGIEAFFNNDLTIDNIITRVTGNSISNIEGTLRANGEANLFLLNPNGITFGSNAQLNIGGSFISSSAESLLLSHGTQFSATNPTEPSLLTVNVPLGLQYGSNPGTILNHSQSTDSNGQVIGLQVPSGETLGLIGGELILEGGYLTTPQGRIELGSVTNDRVDITFGNSGEIVLNYDQVDNFGDIQLSQGSVVNTSGEGGGDVQVQGGKISIQERSFISTSTLGDEAGGNLTLGGSERVEIIGTGFAEFQQTFIVQGLTGTLSPSTMGTGLFSVTQEMGKGGDISIETPQLSLQAGAIIFTPTFGAGQGGNITINAADTIEVNGSGIITSATIGSSGNSGNLTIETGQLQVEDGGVVLTTTLSSGQGGNIEINASESVQILRTLPESLIQTGIIAASLFNTGASGDITLNTNQLSLQDGALLSTGSGTTLGETTIAIGGAGGNLTINASESMEISGTSTDGVFASSIRTRTRTDAAAGNLTLEVGKLLIQNGANLSVSNFGTGDAGNLTIATPDLVVQDDAFIGVNNQGSGDAGTLTLSANTIQLNNGGQLNASTASGEGGNLNLNFQDSLILRNNSLISAQAERGNGGNITLEGPLIIAIPTENSDIVANAVEGRGGNITIDTQGLFGLQLRDQLTPLSDISASSQLGVDGVVTLTTPDVNTDLGLILLPTDLVESSTVVVQGCSTNKTISDNSEFNLIGRGGLPSNPGRAIRNYNVLEDLGTKISSSPQNHPLVSLQRHPISPASPIIEAQGWIIDAQGNIILTAEPLTPNPQSPWSPAHTCPSFPV